MTQLSIIKKSLSNALAAIAKAETDKALFEPFAKNGDEAAAELIMESVGNAADSILDAYIEIGKHAPSLKTISNG